MELITKSYLSSAAGGHLSAGKSSLLHRHMSDSCLAITNGHATKGRLIKALETISSFSTVCNFVVQREPLDLLRDFGFSSCHIECVIALDRRCHFSLSPNCSPEFQS